MNSRRGGLAPFFILTFALTWGLQVPGVLALRGVLPGNSNAYLPLAGLGIFGPLAAAIILTGREGGKTAVKALIAPLLRWRVETGWYLAVLIPAVLVTVLLFLLNLAGRHGPIAYVPSAGGILFGVVASVSEEIGWRGFALPRLQQRWGGFAASGFLGAVWYLWHLPMFMGQDIRLNLVLVMLLFFTGGSLLLTWVYNGTGGSLLLCSLGHLAVHLNNSHRALPSEVVPVLGHAIIFAALGLLAMRGALLRGGERGGKVRKPSLLNSGLQTDAELAALAPRS
ncbi:MAG: CPBP family intramembrane glutamic endopeptidase [Polyangiaceae bacterium]